MSMKSHVGYCHTIYWSGFSYEPMSVEVDVSCGLFVFNIIGLADKTMTESKYRILSALKNCDYDLPQRKNQKVIVSLLPAETKKSGSYADLSIVFSYLIASKQLFRLESEIKKINSDHICCIGEVKLNGDVSVNQDIVHLIYEGIKAGFYKFIIPKNSCNFYNLLPEIEIFEIEKLSDLKNGLSFTQSKKLIKSIDTSIKKRLNMSTKKESYLIDTLTDIEYQKRALLISLAGNHHILLSGAPGQGKSVLADCAEELIDELYNQELIESYATWQIDQNKTITPESKRPFRKPHQSLQVAGLIGNGGQKPGELSLANNGILVLNELCEFDKQTLESLREPLESGYFLVHKNGSGIKIKSNLILIATTNICPCGKIPIAKMAGSIEKGNKYQYCTCTLNQINRYQNKISKPLLERFQIICNFNYQNQSKIKDLPKKDHDQFINEEKNSGQYMKGIISETRLYCRIRNDNRYNQYLTRSEIISFGIEDEAEELIEKCRETFMLSKRKIEHVYKVSRTIADIQKAEKINSAHILEAVGYIKTQPFDIY